MTSLLKTYKTLPLELARGEDVWVWDTAGKKYMDLYAGHAVCSTGHCHPKVVKAIQDQVGKLIFSSNVAAFPLREEAAALLLKHAPAFSAALFANSGAEANENALKMAFSFASAPELAKSAALNAGACLRSRAAASSRSGNAATFEEKISLPTWSWIAFTTLGWQWPVEQTAWPA